MTAKECYDRLKLLNMDKAGLKYCLVDTNKNPYKADGTRARVNEYDDFSELSDMAESDLDKWAGLGISVQASNIIGVDLDHCVEEPLNINTISPIANDIVNMFRKFAYIEFSFSGKGIRILFRDEEINPYRNIYYIKNSKIGVEYYQPTFDGKPSNRFLTITGNIITYNRIEQAKTSHLSVVKGFLDKYMLRPIVSLKSPLKSDLSENKPIEELMKTVRHCYLRDQSFQDKWFKTGIHPTIANPDESETDYWLIDYLYTHVTTDEEKLRLIFEQSPFYKTKDSHHIHKWELQDHRYYKLQFNNVKKQYQ